MNCEMEKLKRNAPNCGMFAVAGATALLSHLTSFRAYSFRTEGRLLNCADHLPKNIMFEIFTGVSRTSHAPTRFLAWQGCQIDADIGNGGRWRGVNVSVGYKAQK